jgi:uncharacterized phage-associated protein
MPNKIIKFQYDAEKAKQAALWLLYKNNGIMDKLQLVKLFFFADREHLAKYGRPIIGGTYYTMRKGPVCSELLDALNECLDDSLTVEPTHKLVAKVKSSTDWLSESDLEVLEDVYKNYGYTDPFRLSEITHNLEVYKKHWPPKDGGQRELIPYEDFFDDLDGTAKKMLEIIYDEQNAWADFS